MCAHVYMQCMYVYVNKGRGPPISCSLSSCLIFFPIMFRYYQYVGVSVSEFSCSFFFTISSMWVFYIYVFEWYRKGEPSHFLVLCLRVFLFLMSFTNTSVLDFKHVCDHRTYEMVGEWVLAVHVLLSTGGEVGIDNTWASTHKKKNNDNNNNKIKLNKTKSNKINNK